MFIKRKPKIDIEAMANIRPTSKFDLKMQCIVIARGNVEEAEKLYSFLAGDINIPDVTPPTPSVMQQIKIRQEEYSDLSRKTKVTSYRLITSYKL